MHLDELRAILLSERETGRLVPVPPDLFERTIQDLEALRKDLDASASADPESDETRLLIERVGSIRETLSDLFRARSEKILALAYTHIEGRHTEREEMKRMLVSEREMYSSICEAIGRCRSDLMGGAEVPLPRCSKEIPEPEPEEITGGESGPRPGFSLVRVREDVEPFMGVDGRIYYLRREDVAVIPRQNAEVLNERNIVLNINLPS
ncbi:MAG: hypothetical protein LUQ25_03900 [Methanoregulaceae archaeon]|nr:hypothetical protein [Methanoregulaceae archaeon]